MKKLLSLLLLTTLLFTFCACNSTEPEPLNQENPSANSEHEDSDPSNENNASNQSGNLNFLTMDPEVACYSLEEYEEYFSTHKVDDDFISFQALSDFGAFDGFVYRITDTDEIFYSYRLTPAPNTHLFVDVYGQSDTLETTTILPAQANTDLRICPGTSKGVERFTHDGLTYVYHNGMLYSIDWLSGTSRVSITLNTYSEEIQNYESTLHLYVGDNVAINALLNKDTAGSVKLAFDNMMAKKAAA